MGWVRWMVLKSPARGAVIWSNNSGALNDSEKQKKGVLFLTQRNFTLPEITRLLHWLLHWIGTGSIRRWAHFCIKESLQGWGTFSASRRGQGQGLSSSSLHSPLLHGCKSSATPAEPIIFPSKPDSTIKGFLFYMSKTRFYNWPTYTLGALAKLGCHLHIQKVTHAIIYHQYAGRCFEFIKVKGHCARKWNSTFAVRGTKTSLRTQL